MANGSRRSRQISTTADARYGFRRTGCDVVGPLGEQSHGRRVDSSPEVNGWTGPPPARGRRRVLPAGRQDRTVADCEPRSPRSDQQRVDWVLAVVGTPSLDSALRCSGHALGHVLAGLRSRTRPPASGPPPSFIGDAGQFEYPHPVGNSSANSAATARARRSYPTPPAPVKVTNRCSHSGPPVTSHRPRRHARSGSLAGGRRLPSGVASRARSGWELGPQALGSHLEHPPPVWTDHAVAVATRSDRRQQSAAVESVSST